MIRWIFLLLSPQRHIFYFFQIPSQPSNSNSDTDVSTDTSIAATPSESGAPVVDSRDRNGTIIARPTGDKYPTLLPTTTVQSQTAPRTRQLRITANFHQNLHLTLPD